MAIVRTCSYVSPSIVAARSKANGIGAFAARPICQGEIVAVWGGMILTLGEVRQLSEEDRRQCVQIEEDLYIWTAEAEPNAADWLNHSCDPNAGMAGQVVVVAMRPIAVGEEVCLDYAMCDGSDYDEFVCTCGVPACRGRISGEDWRNPALIRRYRSYFSDYLIRRIDRLAGSA